MTRDQAVAQLGERLTSEIRAAVRGLLLTASRAEIEAELRLAMDEGDDCQLCRRQSAWRAECIREFLYEEYPGSRALYATIAANGGLFTLTYCPHGSTSSAYKQGYDDSVFDEARGTGIPCVDYRTMDFTGYQFRCVKEAHSVFNEGYTPMAEWLSDVECRGATITQL